MPLNLAGVQSEDVAEALGSFFPLSLPCVFFFNLFVVPFLYSLIVYKLYSILVQRLLFLNVFYVFLNRELELYEKINFNKLYIDINKYEFITHLC